ncbi:MAG: Crp/Fnr family transcriptional regulator [Deltaproteobacteria bacterium]|nr:Crp/Fnr family transcriptional regulator [Deltaproteobacteria bacterium]
MKDFTHKMDFHHFINNIPFLACLSDDEINDIKKITIEKRFSKNQVILQEEDTPHYLYFVYSGKVKVVQRSGDGKERMIAIHKRGDFFGEMAALDGMTAPATVIAIEDAKVGFITRADFENHLLKNRRVLMEIIAMLCGRLREAWRMLKMMSFADAEKRVRIILKNMEEQFGIKDQRGTIINFKLTHKDIAEFASISRETVTRTIKKLVDAGEIEILENRRFLLKPAFLKNNDPL